MTDDTKTKSMLVMASTDTKTMLVITLKNGEKLCAPVPDEGLGTVHGESDGSLRIMGPDRMLALLIAPGEWSTLDTGRIKFASTMAETPAKCSLFLTSYDLRNKVLAIKGLRSATGWPLAKAKHEIDKLDPSYMSPASDRVHVMSTDDEAGIRHMQRVLGEYGIESVLEFA